MQFFNHIGETMLTDHQGAVAFEYVIILVIMAVALFIGFRVLQNQLIMKANDVSKFMGNNGQNQMGTTTATPGKTNGR